MQLATITLIVEILFYLALCAGVVAQLRGKYKWHDRFQAPVVVLNLFFIVFVMIPTFRAVVLGSIPSGLSDVPVLVTAIHGLLGTIAQGLSIYCLLAGFKILPRKIGVLRYWMRAAFAFWTLTILFGIGVYIIFHTGDTSAGSVAEHDADLVAEHDAEEALAETSPPPVEETVAEHAEEALVEAETPAEVVSEHDAEEVVSDEATEAIVAEPEVELIGEHDAEAVAQEGAMPDEGTDAMEQMIDEHAADVIEIVEPEFSGEAGFAIWEQLNPTSTETPGIRYEHAMQYNEATNQIFLFGGHDGDQIYNDVWVLNAETLAWRQMAVNSPTAPPARFSTVMTVDEAGQNLYIATGHTQGGANFNDVWKLDLTTETWQDLTATAGTPPAERYGSPGGNIGGNLVTTHGFGGTRYDDTWQFNVDTGQWENITPPGAVPLQRCLFAATPSETEQGLERLVIHGGCATPFGDCFLDDTWLFDPAAQAWNEISSEVKPVGRQHHTLTELRAVYNRLILYGGQDASRAARSDIWFLDLSTGQWQPLNSDVTPSARYNHSAVWVSSFNGMVIYGGRNETGGLSDMWLATF